MSVAEKEERKRLGKEGEDKLNEWFKSQKVAYVAVCQRPDTFAPMFSGAAKRPDFMLLLEGVGMIAVDAKNCALRQGDHFTLAKERELKLSVAFERLFRMPLWYAYRNNADEHSPWYWISALKAIEKGVDTGKEGNEIYLTIKLEHFARMDTAADFAKLYTHRFASYEKISALPLMS
ncbi:MAG: hypothetical protein V4754_10375 [Pseudomonadota bacterium]